MCWSLFVLFTKTAHFFRGKLYRAPVCVDAVGQTLNNGHIQRVFPGMRIILESKIDVYCFSDFNVTARQSL